MAASKKQPVKSAGSESAAVTSDTPVPDTAPAPALESEPAPEPSEAPKPAKPHPRGIIDSPKVNDAERKAYKATSGIKCGRTGRHVQPGGTVYLADTEAEPIKGILTRVRT